jgi:hypothetical protein
MSETIGLKASFHAVEPEILSQKQHRELKTDGLTPVPVSHGVSDKARLVNVDNKRVYVMPTSQFT